MSPVRSVTYVSGPDTQLRGGAGRTRTSNQTVMGGGSSPISPRVARYFHERSSLRKRHSIDAAILGPLVTGRKIHLSRKQNPDRRDSGSNADRFYTKAWTIEAAPNPRSREIVKSGAKRTS
jgi:hypothetical protein